MPPFLSTGYMISARGIREKGLSVEFLGWLRTGSCHRLLGLLDAVDSVVHGQLVGLAFGDGGGFRKTDPTSTTRCPSFQASTAVPQLSGN